MKDFFAKLPGVAGGLLAFAGLILYGISPDWIWTVTLLELGALALLGYFFFRHFEVLRAFSARRSTRLGANSLLMVLLFLAILVILNFIFTRHEKRFDLSETGKFSLAPQTVKLLENLEREVKVTGFFQENSRPRQEFQDLADSYRYHSDRLDYELIDPDRSPAIAKQYGVAQYNTVVLESGGQEARIKSAVELISEEELTNALIRVSRDEKKVVYFLTGHGEHSIEDAEASGYSQAKEELVKEGFEVKELMLLQQGGIPEDASVLVIAGPQRLFLESERKAIRQYVDRGGRLVVMLDPQNLSELEYMLAAWGVEMLDGIVVNASANLTLLGFDASNALVMEYSDTHAAVKDLKLAALFPLAQSMRFAPEQAPGVRYEVLAKTAPESWAETDFSGSQVRYDPEQDRLGPLDVAAALEFGPEKTEAPEDSQEDSKEPGETEPPGGRVVIIGDSDFVANRTFNFSGNSDFFFSVLHWLAEEQDLISIKPKETQFSPLILTRQQGRIFFLIPVVVLPAAVIAAGIGVWRKRKRL